MSETKDRYPRKRTKFLLGGKGGVKAKFDPVTQGTRTAQDRVWEGGWSVCSSLYNFGCPTPPALDRRSRNACFYRSTGLPPSSRCGLSKGRCFPPWRRCPPLGLWLWPKRGIPWYSLQLQSEEAPHCSCVWTSR